MAAITNLRHQHAALTPVATDDIGDRLAALAAELFSMDAATRQLERAFLRRLVRILTLTPHEIHDLAVAGRLGDLLPPDSRQASSEPLRYADVKPYRSGP